MGKGNI